jgi:tetratricopeptide (TPR) repeat protein
VEGTDRKGRFSFQLGQNLEFQDASANGQDGFGGGFGAPRGPGFGSSSSIRDRDLFGCELRASLPGYRSDSVTLANIHYMDNPDLGTIILHPIAKVDGLTVSATTALAPKDARKAYEKGLEAAGKKNPDEAQKNFEKAVALYPKYAAAWFALGQINEQREHAEQALRARSIDRRGFQFVPPYGRISSWNLRNQMAGAGGYDDHVLQLNPYDYPSAYYPGASPICNSAPDVAEKNAREAIRRSAQEKCPSALRFGPDSRAETGVHHFRGFSAHVPRCRSERARRGFCSQATGAGGSRRQGKSSARAAIIAARLEG